MTLRNQPPATSHEQPVPTHLIVGAGAAGLSLAYALTRHPATAGQTIVLLDADAKRTNDRTWSYWERADQPGLFAELPGLVSAEWATAEVRTDQQRLLLPLAPYVYRTIRGLDFYDALRAHLAALPHVQWLTATVTAVTDGPDHATAHTADSREFRGQWLYDSRFRYLDLDRQPDKYFYLAQHFVGWEIETARDVFDPTVATLFDFRTPQIGQMRFQYVLPTTPRRALVEYTLFSADLLPPDAYAAELRRYLRDAWNLTEGDYRILAREAGVIPMTDHPLPARSVHAGRRVVHIGSRGGASKASTGFTFRRIQLRTAALVDALARTGQPHAPEPALAARFRLYDAMMLDVLTHHGDRGAEVFTQLFQRNPVDRLLRFLNEDSSLTDDLAVMNSVPLPPFLAALARQVGRAFRPAITAPLALTADVTTAAAPDLLLATAPAPTATALSLPASADPDNAVR